MMLERLALSTDDTSVLSLIGGEMEPALTVEEDHGFWVSAFDEPEVNLDSWLQDAGIGGHMTENEGEPSVDQ
jgi:hypothetical protein